MTYLNEKAINIDVLLKMHGFKITPARASILAIFIKSKIPLSAFNVYQELLKNKKIKKINEATVYRNLSLMEKSSILKKIYLRKDSDYFELNNNHHHHIVCTSCGAIEDFRENISIEKLLNKIVERSSKFKNIKEHSLELFGICKVCN